MTNDLHSVHVDHYPRPEKRHKATSAEWSFIRRQKIDGRCRVCGANWLNELHHLVPRAQGGDDYPANLVEVCRSCHTMIEARDESTSMRLGLRLRPDEIAYVTHKKGAWYLADRYRIAIEEAA